MKIKAREMKNIHDVIEKGSLPCVFTFYSYVQRTNRCDEEATVK